MQERIDLIELLLSLQKDELELVLTRAEQELGLRWREVPEPPRQTGT